MFAKDIWENLLIGHRELKRAWVTKKVILLIIKLRNSEGYL